MSGPISRETNVDGRAGQIRIKVDPAQGGPADGTFHYESEGRVAEGRFSITPVEGAWSVLIGERVIRLVPDDAGSFVVDGRRLAVDVFDPRDLRARQDQTAAHGGQQVRASMPGKVVRVLVAAGESVTAGQGLVVVEAMKMQNEIKSLVAGRVAEVRTQAGATVKAGDVLVVIENDG